MSILTILLPPRLRGAPSTAAPSDDDAGGAEWSWALSLDGISVQAQGRGRPDSWPRADSVVAVLADGDVAWHRVTLPKAPAARLRQALLGVLEEQLLDDESLHLALAPDATPGRPTWIAVCQRQALAATLARIEGGGRGIDRVIAAAAPGGPAQGHFMPASLPGDDPEALQLAWADEQGATVFGLAGSLARTRVGAALGNAEAAPRWSATPAAAAAAEAWLGQPIAVLGEAERALNGARSGWNLRQFELAPKHRGATAVRQLGRRLLGPEWRPARVGLIALLVLQLVGLNAWAWKERRAVDQKRAAMVELFRSSFPKVPTVLDAPLQMRAETEALRRAAGQPGDGDLETLLFAAAAGWPEDLESVDSLRFEPGRLTLGVPDWTEDDAARLRARMQPAGWVVELGDQKLTIVRQPGWTP